METTKTYNIKLSYDMYNKFMDQTLKAKDLIKYLLSLDIIENTKEDINETALKDLKCNDEIVIAATVDCLNMCLVLTTEKKVLTIDEVVINDSKLYVRHSNTLMINEVNAVEHDIKDLLKQHKEIVTLAKNKGVKVSYANKTKQYITTNAEAYKRDISNYKSIYNNICNLWKERLKTPIYYGYINDKDINNIDDIHKELYQYKLRSCIIYRFNDIVSNYNRLLEELKQDNCRFIKIVL